MGIFKKSNVKIIKNSILIGLKNQRIARKVKLHRVTNSILYKPGFNYLLKFNMDYNGIS